MRKWAWVSVMGTGSVEDMLGEVAGAESGLFEHPQMGPEFAAFGEVVGVGAERDLYAVFEAEADFFVERAFDGLQAGPEEAVVDEQQVRARGGGFSDGRLCHRPRRQLF